MNRSLSKTILVMLSQLPGPSLCADINIIEVSREKGRYHLHTNTIVYARVGNVRRIITDYENLTSIIPNLKESKLLNKSENERTTVSMLTEICVFFLCYNIRHVQTFHTIKDDILFSRIIPGMGNFQSGWMRWEIKEIDSNKMTPVTQIILDIEMTPDFFVPPLIGPYQIKKKMLEITSATINKLEEKAKIIYPG
ncbi:MAG: hypothetical protein IIA99_05645 [Proteobacteria bacterium]|nr:hypothetical protein [Pseudomonadota bacterium]